MAQKGSPTSNMWHMAVDAFSLPKVVPCKLLDDGTNELLSKSCDGYDPSQQPHGTEAGIVDAGSW